MTRSRQIRADACEMHVVRGVYGDQWPAMSLAGSAILEGWGIWSRKPILNNLQYQGGT